MRTALDALDPLAIGPDAPTPAIALAYVDHHANPSSYAQMCARFPSSTHGAIVPQAQYNAGAILDVENTDATPEQAPGWCVARRQAGQIPTVYMSLAAWPAVRTQFTAQRVAPPAYWVADYIKGPAPLAIPPAWVALGCVAWQWTDLDAHGINTYDTSIVGPYWPGVDPPPEPPAVLIPPTEGDTEEMPSQILYVVETDPTTTPPTEQIWVHYPCTGIYIHVDGASAVDNVTPMLEAAGPVPIVGALPSAPQYAAAKLHGPLSLAMHQLLIAAAPNHPAAAS